MEKICETCKFCMPALFGKSICTNNDNGMMGKYIDTQATCDSYKQVEVDMINNPPHYTNRQYECIDEMIAMFGEAAVISFCKCNAWKYRYRADSKGKHDEDMAKADWYINKAMELQTQKRKGNDW